MMNNWGQISKFQHWPKSAPAGITRNSNHVSRQRWLFSILYVSFGVELGGVSVNELSDLYQFFWFLKLI